MPLMIAVTLFVVLLAWAMIRKRSGGAMVTGRPSGKVCTFERVDENSERTLQEYRCTECGQAAYGRVDQPPAQRTCKTK